MHLVWSLLFDVAEERREERASKVLRAAEWRNVWIRRGKIWRFVGFFFLFI